MIHGGLVWHVLTGLDRHGQPGESDEATRLAANEATCSSITRWVLSGNVESLIDLADFASDLAKADLHPATSIFIPLPSSSLHYFVAKINPQGIAFELLKLARVQAESGIGTKLVVGDRTPMDLGKMRREGKRESRRGGG